MNPRIAALEARRDELNTALEALDQAVVERGSDLTDEERATYEANEAELTRIIGEDLPRLVKREQDLAASHTLGASLGDAVNRNDGKPTHTGDATGDPVEVYRGESKIGAPNFFVDMYRARSGDRQASERLDVHRNAAIERATASTDLPGLVIPKYAVDKYQPLAIARRNFLNTLVGTPAYGGNVTSGSVVIPRETVALPMGPQTAQNTAFATANWATEAVTINAVTVGGYSDVAVQAIQLNQIKEDRIFAEMTNRYYQEQERQALWGSGSGGEAEGLFEADGTQAIDGGYSATGFAEVYGLVQEAASLIETTDEREAQWVLMSPARWRSMMSATDSEGRPVAGGSMTFPSNVGAYIDGQGNRWFGGMRAVVSSKVVKSGEDDTVMAVYNTDAFYFEESDPYNVTADQVVIHAGSIRFVEYGFMIFSPEIRLNSLCIIRNLGEPDFPMAAVS